MEVTVVDGVVRLLRGALSWYWVVEETLKTMNCRLGTWLATGRVKSTEVTGGGGSGVELTELATNTNEP